MLTYAAVISYLRRRPRRKDRPRCGAKTRAGGTCMVRVEFGKARCRFHGGLSTGPKTEVGRARIAEAQRRRWRAYREGGPSERRKLKSPSRQVTRYKRGTPMARRQGEGEKPESPSDQARGRRGLGAIITALNMIVAFLCLRL
jgi:hypothetical protein